MKCQFPYCNFVANAKHQLHKHHIIPKELGGNNEKWNLIYLCPTCHNRIYVPGSSKGIHSIQANNSIILIGFKNNGMFLEYIETNQTKYYEY